MGILCNNKLLSLNFYSTDSSAKHIKNLPSPTSDQSRTKFACNKISDSDKHMDTKRNEIPIFYSFSIKVGN